MLGRLLLGSLAAALLASPFAGAQEEFKDDVRKILNDATDLYKRGKYPEAAAKFEEAFQKQPTSDIIYAFMQRVGEDVIASMMTSKDATLRAQGYRLFELSKPAGDRIRKGKAVVLKYIEALGDNDFSVQTSARWHLKNIGPYAARFLVPYLGHAQEDLFRSRVILTLTDMGTDVSLAVAEALHSKNPTMRRNAAAVLGNIKDDRTVPALKRAYENPNETPEVKKLAAEALIKITRQTDPEGMKSAKEYYFDFAENLYNQSPAAVHAWNRAWLFWKWDDEKDTLGEREVPRFAWTQWVAEEALHDALTLDPEFRDAKRGSPWSLLACVSFQQAIDAESALAAAEAAIKAGDPGFLPDHLEQLKETLGGAERNAVLAKSAGRAHLYEALDRCLRDGNGPVAVAILETLKVEGSADDLPVGGDAASAPGGPLILALTHEDKRVRYAAAAAYATLNPKEPRLAHQLVIKNLADAIGEQGVRSALIICDIQDDTDRNFINALRRVLEQANVHPIVAASGGDGVVKAKQFPTKDVILVHRKVAGQIYFKEEPSSRKRIVETVYDTLRDDVRTRSIPRVILADSPAELEESKTTFGSTAQGFMMKNAGVIEFKGLFDQLFSSAEAQKDSKDRADRMAQLAAETLAGIDPTNTHLEYREAVDSLIKTVDPTVLRLDGIRIAAARALGRYGDQRAVDVLSKALAVKSDDAEQAKGQKAVRLQFAKSLAAIFRQVRMAPSKDVFDNLKKQLTDGDVEIEAAVAEALGNCDLTAPQRLEVAAARRVNSRRSMKGPDDE